MEEARTVEAVFSKVAPGLPSDLDPILLSSLPAGTSLSIRTVLAIITMAMAKCNGHRPHNQQ